MKYREALEDMVWQFADRGVKDSRLILWTGGLSALEHAFVALGWDDPHYVDNPDCACDVERCPEWASPQVYWDGVYSRICSKHFGDYLEKQPRPQMKQRAIDREATRRKMLKGQKA